MRVVVSAGGTGGHIYPALAIIDKIKEKEKTSEFLYIGTHNRMEKDIVPKRGIPYKEIEIYGFNKKTLKNIKLLKCVIKSYKECKKTIKNFNPDIVIGVGGYVTAPVILAAHKLGYKTFIHEQNSVPGKTNRFLGKYADKIGISFENSAKYFDEKKVIFTGNPCNEAALNSSKMDKKEVGLSDNKDFVYIVMGSLGSDKMSNILVEMLSKFEGKNYEVVLVTGTNHYDKVKDMSFPKNVKVLPYVDNQTRLMKQAKLVVSRCGATTLGEIITLGLPSIIIPSPYVADNHQYKNGLILEEKQAALMIEEKDLTIDNLYKNIDNLMNDSEKLSKMRENLKGLTQANGASNVYNVLASMIGDRNDK